jgi:hypothetical protein
MTRRMTISYNRKEEPTAPTSTYYPATATDVLRFYLFDEPVAEGGTIPSLIDRLDRGQLLGAGDKDTAKTWAKRLGLASFIYVRV